MTLSGSGNRGLWTAGMAAVAFGVVALIVVANVHLVAVSLRSQPDCVAHLKVSGAGSDGYRAASSSC